ncbi:MAG TPA: efflux RND transporter periplasmic adaptor subunit [Limnobacter sp.]|uniref:efflux RND transporter periplasmic adaptor subunit n=1 Tax=Limnobacter sp. TaxID=2003368 RepID=UPI002ED8F0BB
MNRSAPLSLIATALVASLLLSACGPAKPEAEAATANAARVVKVQTVSLGPGQAAIEVAGVGAFRDETKLSFKVGGVIEQITVREGDSVKPGQKLAWLNQQEVNAAVSQAAAGLDKAQRDLKRGEQLRSEEVISSVQLDNLKTALQVAQAQASQASFARQTAEVSARAPGVVLKRFAQVGEVVAPGQPVLLLGSRASGFVMKASLSDKQAIHVQVGQAATAQFDAVPGVQWPAKVIELAQAADPATGTYGVQVLIDTQANPALNVLSGMQGQLRIQPADNTEQRSYVPLEAVIEGDNKAAWLFTVEANNSVKRRAVKVAFVQGNRLALAEPLPEGTRVVSVGAAYLQDGETVQIAE